MTATLSFEVEITLSGTVVPYRPATGPTYSSGGDPAEGGYAEDVEITGMGLIESSRQQSPMGVYGTVWTTKSFLEGVDLKSPDIQRLFANILALKEDEASEAIMEDHDDGAP